MKKFETITTGFFVFGGSNMNLLRNCLLAIFLACMMIVPLSGAQNNTNEESLTNHFKINVDRKNVTHIVAFNVSSETKLDPYGIQKPEELRIPKELNKLDVVTFNHSIINDQLKSGQIIIISIDGKDYSTELFRMNFENIDDGIDSYHGTFSGIKNSDILLTTGENILIGRVTLENETIWIIPVEPRYRTINGSSPLHIIYNSNDVPIKKFIIDNETVTINSDSIPVITQALSNQTRVPRLLLTPPDQIVNVNILVATDQAFFTNEPNWTASAQNIIAEANWVLNTTDIRVQLVPLYDASRHSIFSTDGRRFSNPLDLFFSVYPPRDLDNLHTDIAIYLGGYDKTTDNDQGASYGFTRQPDWCRYAWAQMVPDGISGYMGTEHGRQVVSIHEIGHMFDAGHETRDASEPQYARAFSWPYLWNTVMWSEYWEGLSLTHFSSNDQGYMMGDNNHDNSRRISETRDIVAMYAHKDRIGVFRPANGNWYMNYNYSYSVQKWFHFGTTGDIPLVGDYNRDGYADAWLFRPANGNWYVDYTLDGQYDITPFHFGMTGDVPVVGNFGGNTNLDAGIFRPSNGNWYLDYNLNGQYDKLFHFGTTGDIPIVGDWGGNGITDVGIYRPSSGEFCLDTNKDSNVEIRFLFGTSEDIPVVGDWDGNGITDVGVFRPSTGYWYLDTNKNTGAENYFPFGISGDIPVVGDWNGSGYSHAWIFRPSTGNWCLKSDEVGTITFHFGTSGDKPNIGVWRRETEL